MDIRISGRRLSVTEGMRDHSRQKLLKLERYAPRIVEAHVILQKEKYRYEAEITLLAKNLRAFGEASSKENIYAAIDQACVRVEKQLKRFREKVKDHRRREAGSRRILQTPLEQEAAGPEPKPAGRPASPKIVPIQTDGLKSMTPEEAARELKRSAKPFMIFLNRENRKAGVLYRREDGDYGLVVP